ncbi:thiol reductant ABC exporter subunit CydD [Halalkalibacter sp. APA_J-10(15)]|uniref:thiol reductant ABC exporter subunit CydD n=1 Tax=unclassified Halalkalibacter TaxID=2893063 RepID=UPI001FF0FEDA|nr:thiol reductant ABC exporter subunit CydD [Halalkalibacter sp. APA_J-10(15)]MCK0472243.1 thiol reductant ABC exporter subunit CydD [Halalkalibacter sp. APA_J-10(15)]
MKILQRLATAERKPYSLLYVVAIAFGVVVIAQAYLIVTIVNDVFLRNVAFEHVIVLLFVLLGVLLMRALLSYWSNRLGVSMATKIKEDIRKRLLQAYGNESLSMSYQGQSGAKVSVMLDTVDEIDSFFRQYVPQRMVSTIAPVMILIVIFSQHVYSGLILLVTAPFIPVFMAIIGGMTQRKSEEKLESMKAFSGRFLDTLQGIESLKVYGKSKKYKELIRQSSLRFRDTTMEILKVAFTSSLMLEFISMLSIGLVALELGLRLIVFQQIDFFTAFFILLLVPEFFNLLKELGSAFHAGRSSSGAAEKIEEELQKKEQRMEWGHERFNERISSFQLQNVHFHYRSEGFKLNGINTRLPRHGQVALVGKSGAGKTTLLHIMSGLLQPTEGGLYVNGLPLTSYKESEWFNQISYVTQHPYLFAGTIAENITMGLDVTEEELRDAAEKAGILDLITSFPDEFQTMIGEGGRGLSGGEKQRIAISRAFLKRPAIVLFDEPTSGLDLVTEQVLHASIEQLAEQALVITVAHRLQTIKRANYILFLENGALLAEGKHEQLLKQSERYAQMLSENREVE